MSSSSIRDMVSGRALKKTARMVLWVFVAIGGCMVTVMGVELAQLAKVQAQPRLAGPLPRPHTGGSLVIVGGGKMPDEVRDRFVDLAGGPKARIVVIPTAHTAPESAQALRDVDMWKAQGVEWVLPFHARSREQANDPGFVKPLKEATAVWFTGGQQSLVTGAYLDTEVERQLKALLDRGGVIGGSSAGAAIMTRIMITGGRNEATEGRGFDFLPGSIVDQHFMKRNRISRLLGLLTKHPDLLGFGIDESTALIVVGSHYSVIGNSYVMACVPGSTGQPARLEFLKKGDQVDLAALKTSDVSVTSSINLDELLSVDTR
jgi:cyanophycinase